VSAGGVPKLPVDHPVRVGPLGLEDDAHREDTVHGGPHRAVALFANEAIRRVAAEGHPIFPGSCGENLTTEGIELAELPIGTRLAIGDELVLEIAAPDNPCSTVRGSFADERFARISMLTHPTDSRMYARVLREGLVQAGDPIAVLPPAADTRATELALLARLGAAHRKSSIAVWMAGEAAGLDLRIVDDGEIALVAAPGMPGRWLNRGLGFALLPNLVDRGIDHFRRAGTTGWLDLEPTDSAMPASEPDEWVTFHAIQPDRVPVGPEISGLAIRRIRPEEAGAWARTLLANGARPPGETGPWMALAPQLAGTAHHSLWLAELDGIPVATASLHTHRKVGWLRLASVARAVRGRGIHRALIAARARAAAGRAG
jgi:MOSC domain-containing protein YiiM